MKEVLRKQVMQNVFLTCLTTNKFKTGQFSVTLLTELNKNDAAKNALLPKVLRRGTARHPDMESISACLAELYGAVIEPVVRKKGEIQCVGFYSDFPDDFFIPGNEKILEKVLDLCGEMLIAPATKGGKLINEYVLSERDNLVDQIRSISNDKRTYAALKLIENMCADERYGIGWQGREQDAAKITATALTRQYKKLLPTARIEMFYCGSAEYDRVEMAVLSAFASLPRGAETVIPETDILTQPVKPEVRMFTEEMDVTQGKLSMGFRMGESMLIPDYPAMMVFNALYGGGAASKLFANVRERLSLCYYASSNVDKHKGIMTVSSGIEFDKFETARDEIFAQLENVKNGDFTAKELDSAKKTVINSLRSYMDEQMYLENYYLDGAITGVDFSPEIMAGLADDVTAEDVVKIASGVKADSIYFLTGNGGTADES